MITTKELAVRWKMATGTLINWRSKGLGPKFIKIGRKVLYKETSIESFEKRTSAVNRNQKASKKNRNGRT